MKIIKYQFMMEINLGTEEPNIVQTFYTKERQCSDKNFDVSYAIAQREAYGEITVEEIPDPVTPPSPLEKLEAQVAYIAMMSDLPMEV